MESNNNWADPRHYAAALKDEENLVFLYSGMAPGRYSILAWELEEKVDSLDSLQAKLSTDKTKFNNCWFGFLGYGLRTKFERLTRSRDSYITLPDLLMMRFKNVMIFDHHRSTSIYYN